MTEYKLNGVRVDLRRKKYSQEKMGLLWPSVSHICELSFLPVEGRKSRQRSGHAWHANAVWRMFTTSLGFDVDPGGSR